MYDATPTAFKGPTFWAPEQVPRTVVTSPKLSTASHSSARVVVIPGPGRVKPAVPCATQECDQQDGGDDGSAGLRDEIGRDPLPREIAAEREGQGHGRIEVRTLKPNPRPR